MKIISTKPKGQRIFKSNKIPYFISPLNHNLWFDIITGQWTIHGNSSAYYAMECHGFNSAYSLKAVKRLIHNWNVIKGTEFNVSLPWTGFEFKITK